MRLADAWIHGLRRFGGDRPHRVRFDTKLVCLIGANEAGKSTILNAVEIGVSPDPVEPTDRTRREHVPDDREVVRLRYRLDAADREALATVGGSATDPKATHWYDLIKRADGSSRSVIEPELARDLRLRTTVGERLEKAAEGWWPSTDDDSELDNEEAREGWAPERERYDRIVEALSSGAQTLTPEVVVDIGGLATEIQEEDEDLSGDLAGLAGSESARHPSDAAAAILRARIPDFVRFDEPARILESEYDLGAVADDPPPALRNLAALADLNLSELRSSIDRGETGTTRDLREAANRRLAERFAAWQQQPPVTVVLENTDRLLQIHVQSGAEPTMSFHERSEGLRQFVALVALTAQHNRTVSPILLIDEVETHLHYDAQADLLSVLGTQTAVAQVVYTTHSAACLPEDLGLGVRVVEGFGDRMASTVRQNFWRDDHPGMGALLMAIGAASLAYVPLQPAVIAEGGTELVLFPSLLREAIQDDHLDFAVVPGSSSTPPERIAGLDLQGVRTAWIFDADDAGRARMTELAESIPAERLVLLTDDGELEIEDLVYPETYCAAVNLYLADVGSVDEFAVDDLPEQACARHETVEAWCAARNVNAPGKIAVANKVLELAGDAPLLDPAHAERLRALHANLKALLAT